MGNTPSSDDFKFEDLEVYEECTCLTGAEILELHEKFTEMGGVREKDNESERVLRGAGADMRMSMATGGAAAEAAAASDAGRKVTMAAVCNQSELKNNPFKQRLCQIFSSEPKTSDTYGDLSFDEFVDLYNAMSPRASREVKMQTAFRLYDYDHNGYLTKEDLAQLLRDLSTARKKGGDKRQLLSDEEIEEVVDRVMRDCDIDGNNRLSYTEFSKVLLRIPDFALKFRIFIQ